jgi:hypothetical protein
MSVDGQPYRHVSPFHQRSLEALPIIPFCSPIYDANLRLLEGSFVLVSVHFASTAAAFFSYTLWHRRFEMNDPICI